jgi:para-aminobenzoate synthetase component 1
LQRQKAVYQLAEGQYEDIKYRMLNWASRFGIFVFLDSNNFSDRLGRFECVLAAGIANGSHAGSLEELQQLFDRNKDWLFGHICYDHKNALENKLTSVNAAKIGWDDLFFFRPEVVCYVDKAKTTLTIESLATKPDEIYSEISNQSQGANVELPKLQFNQKLKKEDYLQTISALRQHIKDGDCYEINFCSEGYAENVTLKPLSVFKKLCELSPAPFSAFYKNNDKYLICASPERYLYKQGRLVLSQPMKGTAPRGVDAARDQELKTMLQQSTKDRAENVMIVDLVRNDIARSCETSSVAVEELFGIYSFPQVHQMVSTVSGKLKQDIPLTDAIRYSFPMGSMTGAPKIKVMELIDRYEQSRRELFSGTVGYITPDGDFDFNVVIRSLHYNSSSHYLSYQTGGAITYDSTPEQEWEEMRLKAAALEKVFS